MVQTILAKVKAALTGPFAIAIGMLLLVAIGGGIGYVVANQLIKAEEVKKAAQKDVDATIAARATAIKKNDLPTAADIMAKLREDAKSTGNAFPNSGSGNYRVGPSKSQTDLEKQREAFAENVKSQKEMIASSAAKDVKATLDEGHKVPGKQKLLTADEQKVQDDAQKAEAKKAAEVKKQKYGGIHYNRK